MWVIYHFVTRDTIGGRIFGKEQAITREAIRAMTTGNACLTLEENIKGPLESGKPADLVVLSEDIMTCPEPRIQAMSVLMTMVGNQAGSRGPASGL